MVLHSEPNYVTLKTGYLLVCCTECTITRATAVVVETIEVNIATDMATIMMVINMVIAAMGMNWVAVNRKLLSL